MGAMTLSATREWDFSSEQGKANYKAAQRRYPAQAIVDLAALRDNMRHLVSVVGGPHSGTAVMGIVKADAYGHGLVPAALAALAGGATWLGTAQSHEALPRMQRHRIKVVQPHQFIHRISDIATLRDRKSVV